MNVFLREMKANRKSLIIWGIGIILFITSGMRKYSGMSSSSQSMNDLMESMPKSLQAIMGTGSLDLSTAGGYYGILYLYLLLMATIHAAMLGSTMIAKEERDKTSEFLFVKPLSRTTIIGIKLAAAVMNVFLFNLVTLGTSMFVIQKYGNEASIIVEITNLMIGMFLLQLLFMAIGMAIASGSKMPKRAASISTGILLLTFLLSIVIDLNEKLEVLQYFTPFKYFEAENIIRGTGLDTVFVIVSVVVITILLSMTFIFFKKKDLSA